MRGLDFGLNSWNVFAVDEKLGNILLQCSSLERQRAFIYEGRSNDRRLGKGRSTVGVLQCGESG
jgi:hypothetical protein